MEKRGLAYIAFIALIIAAVALVIKEPKITGNQVIDPTTARMSIETMLNNMGSTVAGGNICIAISDPTRPVSYVAFNIGGTWTVSEAKSFFCDGMNSQDFNMIFSSYDSLSRVLNDPSPRSLAMSAIARDFEIVPSRYVEQGGNVICDASFKVKYCPALTTMGDPEQLIDADLVCCLDSLTKEQKALLEEHMQEGNFKDELGIVEQPSAGLDISSLILPAILVIVILGGVGAYMMLGRKSHKPTVTKVTPEMITGQPAFLPQQPAMQPTEELFDYTVQVLQQGYSPEELLAHYLEQGWDEPTATKVINDAVNNINQAN